VSVEEVLPDMNMLLSTDLLAPIANTSLKFLLATVYEITQRATGSLQNAPYNNIGL